MEKVRFNALNVRKRVAHDPRLHIDKRGTFSFNKVACENMGLKIGDYLEFIQDKDNPSDWYIVKSEKGKGIQLNKSTSGQLKLSSMHLSIIIRRSIEWHDRETSLHFLVAYEPVTIDDEEMWAIITSSAK